jgi:outer membrane protein assembly factor BamB
MGPGTVTRTGTDGKLIQKDWVSGLTSNKGSALYKGFFYTAETAAIAVIDVKTAAIIKRIPVNGAIMLNDLAMDDKGIIYVSDTRAGKVYRVDGEKAELYLDNLPGANGLLTVHTDLYVLTSNSIKKTDAMKTTTTIADGFDSGLDGIVMVADNEFIISNYQGVLYYLQADGTKQILSDTRSERIMANDISFDHKTKTLFVPSYNMNRVIAYKVK